MGTINLNIDPSKEILMWSGGIDSTLGVYLAIKQYGAANLNILQYARVFEEDVGKQLSSFNEILIDKLGIDRSMLLSDYARTYKDMGQNFMPMIAEKANSVGKYSFVMFDTEQETPTADREIASHLENILTNIPIEKRALLNINSVFKHLNIDRGEVIDMYKANNIESLLPLTRSCSVKADVLFLKVTTELTNLFTFTEEEMRANKHCGVCYKCLKRKYGFKSVGETDPTTYLR